MRAARQIAIVAAGMLIAVALFGPLSLGQAGGSCTADVSAEFRKDEVHDDFIDKVFMVKISSPAQCAMVTFDLTTTERLANGEIITITTRNERKTTSSGGTAERYTFRIAKDTTLVSWAFKYVSCTVCGL